jgi:predicted AAA+ superfamily ATPase
MIPNIGENMKALVDLYPTIKVILTGSSSFDLAGQIGEPLLGRQTILNLFPLWEKEIADASQLIPGESLEQALLYGHYPEIVTQSTVIQKIKKLQDLAGANLFKDILAFDRLKKPQIILDLLSLLSYQLGNEVSVTELATKLGIDQKTVEKYLTILEQAFIIFPLRAYATNPRKELRTKKKYYFYDLGIRNTLINNFSNLTARTDVGALWENFCIIERMKKLSYTNQWADRYFWRSFTQTEVDYIELCNNVMSAYEFKWGTKKTIKIPELFSNTYPNASWEIIHPENYTQFIR